MNTLDNMNVLWYFCVHTIIVLKFLIILSTWLISSFVFCQKSIFSNHKDLKFFKCLEEIKKKM